MNFGSLFSGVGGLDLGLERAGMQCRWQVEIDDYATRVLEKHWPNVRRWRDVRTYPPAGEWEVDLICGGFPCPPVSVAGQRRGMADERWLWPEFRRIVGILRPRFVLVENVRGLLSANAGRAFGGILRDLARLGYGAEWQVLPAAAFGAPHIRERVFIVADAASIRRERHQGREPGSEKEEGWLPELGTGSQVASNSNDARTHVSGTKKTKRAGVVSGSWRAIEPVIRRGDDGVPNRVDRLKCLGNAVVPSVAEWIGRRIIEANK